MSRNGSGTYTLPAGNPVVTGTTISSTWANNTLNDIAATLTDSVAADGQTPMTGDLNLNTNKIVNLTPATFAGDAVEFAQFTTPTFTGNVTMSSTGFALLPAGTTAQRSASPANGMIRYNTTSNVLESYINGVWTTIGSAVPVAGPAFSAYLASNQSVTSSVATKVNIDTEEFDTDTDFDTTTNRFTPTQAGYYQINGTVYFAGTANTMTESRIYLYKNGSVFKNGTAYASGSSVATLFIQTVNTLMYFNGTTDYVELWAANTSTSPSFAGGSTLTYFSGSFIRS
jgi:hypothetical protein